jgi:ABC-type Fe3+/spermidine/putrescine transport system ATPase subunit
MSLDAHIIATVGTLELDVELVIEPGQVVALLGPNGAGKTTVLRCLAGLLPVDNGYVRLGSETWDDAARDVSSRTTCCSQTSRPSTTLRSAYAPEASRHARRRLPLPRGWNGSA